MLHSFFLLCLCDLNPTPSNPSAMASMVKAPAAGPVPLVEPREGHNLSDRRSNVLEVVEEPRFFSTILGVSLSYVIPDEGTTMGSA